MAFETKVKRWGNSIGIIIPNEFVENENIKENDKIIVNIVKEADLSDIFGSLNRKLSGQKFKDFVKQGWE